MRSKLLILTVLLSSISGFSQNRKELEVNVSSFKAIHLGKTKPLKELIRLSVTDRDKKSKAKARVTAAPTNFIGRKGSNAILPELEHQGIDPIRQFNNTPNGRATAITPSVNIDGLASSFGSPNDPTGDVGLDYYVQAINATDIAVYDKDDGSLVDQFAANTLWSSINEVSAGDPIILFDHEYNRWIITEFTSPNGTANLLFAISDTSDPLGSYNAYSYSPPNFPDYPKWAIWSDTYMVTTNELGPGSLHQYFFDRAAFIAGDSEVAAQRVEIAGNSSTEAGFYVTTPVSWIGDVAPEDNKPIAIKINDSSWGEVANDAVEVFIFDVDFENETTVTKTTIETTAFDGYPCDNANGQDFSCLSQKGSSQGIDAIPEVIMNLPHYRNFETHESIVLSFITDVTDGDNLAGIRWMELRRTTGDWELYQEGTYAPDDGLHRFMPSISLDKDGNIGLAYNTTSSSEFVGIKYTGRYAEDPLGTMTVTEYGVVDGTGSVGGDRFGDYAQMAVDPQNERTFWYTSEYAASGGSKTRIVAFQLEANANDLTVNSIDEPNTSTTLTATETVSVTVENIGTQAASNFDIILSLDDVVIETYTHTPSLAAGASLAHDFGTTVDLSALGDYEISVEVDLTGDELPGNNSLTKNLKKIAENDASISSSAIGTTCNNVITAAVTITNEGGNTLESVDIEVYLNASLEETINWTGSLETGEEEIVEIEVSDLSEGNNDISIVLVSPNEVADEVPGNNGSDLVVNLDSSLDQIVFTLNTDEYPEETTWEMLDGEGNVIVSGGPYPEDVESTVTEYICVDPDACYEFVIYDAFDDGICCGFGSGSYSIADANGNTIFAGNGQFGEFESTAFCIGTECNLAIETDVINASTGELGSIIIDASGSYGYEYSIDDGETFQESPVFDELAIGTYDIYVLAQDGNCVVEETVTLAFDCDLTIAVNQEVTGDGIGDLEIIASGGDSYEYSIDGGDNFQSSNIFTGVESGTYEVLVVSNSGNCEESVSFNVDFVLGTSIDQSITVAPNPTKGVFKVTVPGHDYIKGFLQVQVIDLNGRIIQSHRFSRYDQAFEGTVSLYAYPNGIYFLKLVNAESDRLIKILKQ
ncbi:CARDB domain-containing protein [Ekhidna sp. To15]|uniref:CARDB domain-containing protein n=1 Tax=Ekhidna sp. To15 TaxID=3395267 RepID=UPI003F51C24E